MLIHIDKYIRLYDPSDMPMPEVMPLLITTQRRINGQQRFYYVAADDHLLLLVVLKHSAVEIARGDYFEGLVGWDSGYAPFVPEAQRGLKHTKVTLSRPINSLLDLENIPHPFEVHQLSEILARAPLKPESILHGQD